MEPIDPLVIVLKKRRSTPEAGAKVMIWK